MISFSTVLLADVFDRYRIQLAEDWVNRLTPLWILCLGATAGLALCAVLWGLFWTLSRIPGVSKLSETPLPRRIAIGVLSLGLLAAAFGISLNLRDTAADQPATGTIDLLWFWTGALFVCWLFGYMIVTLLRPRALAETKIALREGVLWPLLITAIVMSVFSVVGLVVVRKPTELLDSLVRWPKLTTAGTVTRPYEIPPPPNEFEDPPETTIDVNFRKDEIREISARADQQVKVRTESFEVGSPIAFTLTVPPGEDRVWRRLRGGINPFRDEVITKLYVKNYGNDPATLQLTTIRQIAYPEMLLVPLFAVGMAGVFLFYLFLRAAMPKLAAVALSTAKSDIAQPLYVLVMAVGIVALLFFVVIPYNTFGDDLKQFKDSGLSLILVLCIIQAVWAASTSVADEVEGKTALTVLSKPVSRRDFIIGKFVGIGWSSGLLVTMLGLVLLASITYKVQYDHREGGYEVQGDKNADPTWQNCHEEMVQAAPGLVLVYLETLVMVALSVAISTRLPMLPNFIICFSIYVLGHLTPLMVQSQVVANQLPPVVFFGQLIATVLPVLDHFNIQASVATGTPVPYEYLAWSLVYCALYSTMAMLLALTLFEDRDLA